MKKNYRYSAVLCAMFISILSVNAQSTSIENVYHYTLKNGLQLFVAENDSVPLTYIELAVRGGGISQTEETVGLFHLYEHMIFKGNTKYPGAAAVQRAIKDLGVPSWNGTTSNEYVNYFFTVPSDLTYEGLEFWSYAIREPLLDEQEFENEKKVVIAELQGGYSEPSRIFYNALYKNAFPDTPWQFDPGGDVANIQTSTLEELKEMQATYYVPNNTAVFVGGDVRHDEVYAMVEEIFGDWEKAADPWADKSYLVPNEAFTNQLLLVQANPQVSNQMAQVNVFYRGPDTEADINATYPADVFAALAANPNSNFTQAYVDIPDLGIPNSDYVGAGYRTARNGSMVSFSAAMLFPFENIVDRVMLFADTTQNMANDIVFDPDFFTLSEYAGAKRFMQDSQIYQTQTPQGLLSIIRYYWASAGVGYYFDYLQNLNAVQAGDMADFFDTYILGENAIITVTVNPTVYEAQKSDFEQAGFTLITDENAFWWK